LANHEHNTVKDTIMLQYSTE